MIYKYIMIYCLSCKKPTKDDNVKAKVTKNKRPYITSNCDKLN